MLRYLILIILMSCTQVASLNLRRHEFGLHPTKIIWLQLPGWQEEHQALYKFFNASTVFESSFQKFDCVGKMWGFNLTDLRSTYAKSFLSQMTGKKNIEGTCEDVIHKPIWQYLQPLGYQTVFYETGSTSLLDLSLCNRNERSYLADTTLYITAPHKRGQSKLFNSESHQTDRSDGVYFDESCNETSCYSTFGRNVFNFLDQLQKNNQHFLYIIRDSRYLSFLKKNEFTKASEVMREWEIVLNELENLRNNNDYLIIVSGAESMILDFPDQGRQWAQFEKTGKGVVVRRQQLMNPLMSLGSRAENFCGIYEESQVFERILSSPRQQGLKFKLINPF